MHNRRSKSDKHGSSGRSTPRSLIVRLKDDETNAWRELVLLYAPLIFHWCRKEGLPADELADVVQDVFRSVIKSIGRFRKEQPGDTFRGWLRTITRNKVNDHFRKISKEPRAIGGTEAQLRLSQVPDDEDDLPADDGDATEEQRLLVRALGMIRMDITDQSWQAFWKVVVEGHSAIDVGAELGMSAGAVRVAKSRVLKRLRKQLGEFE
jgi:RNA polymerase sigma-70 factor (ECF subfamily)